jgi:hypothetical protein
VPAQGAFASQTMKRATDFFAISLALLPALEIEMRKRGFQIN